MSEQNPFAVPEFSTAPEIELRRSYGGLRRAPYVGYSILIAFVQNVLLAVVLGGSDGLGLILVLGGLIAHLFVGAKRLQNLGYSALWLLGLFVPLLNILVGLRMLAAPEGYADHNTLDGPAKVLTGGALLFFVGIVLLLLTLS